MSNITNMPQVFDFDQHEVRTLLDENNNPLFVAKDVATALGYKDLNSAIKQFCDGVAKHHPIIDSLGREQKVRVIYEPDVYRLIFGSKLKSAVKFQDFVFSKVLPQLRQTGTFTLPEHLNLAQLDPKQADLTRQIMIEFIKDYGHQHTPKGFGVDPQYAIKFVHKFVRNYYNVSSYKNLSLGDVKHLKQVLRDNERIVLGNAKGIFGVDINKDPRVAIEQENEHTVSFRTLGRQYYETFTIEYILNQKAWISQIGVKNRELEAELKQSQAELKQSQAVLEQCQAQKNPESALEIYSSMANITKTQALTQTSKFESEDLLLDSINLTQNTSALLKSGNVNPEYLMTLLDENMDLLLLKLQKLKCLFVINKEVCHD